MRFEHDRMRMNAEEKYGKWRENLTKDEIEEILSDHWGDCIC